MWPEKRCALTCVVHVRLRGSVVMGLGVRKSI